MEIRPDMIKSGEKINGQCNISANIMSIRLEKCTQIMEVMEISLEMIKSGEKINVQC